MITLSVLVLLSIPCFSQTVVADRPASEKYSPGDSLYNHIQQERSAELVCRFAYTQDSKGIRVALDVNAPELERLSVFVRRAINYSEFSISRIFLTGYSSIEGDYAHNEMLSRERVEQFKRYLSDHFPELNRYPLEIAWVAEDWKGLLALVETSAIDEREEILEIIRSVRVFDDREMLLKRLNGGRAYRTMETGFFPLLRRVELRIEYKNLPSDRVLNDSDPLIYNVLDEKNSDFRSNRSLALAQEKNAGYDWSCSERSAASFYRFAIKTNALLWAGIQPDFKQTAPVANAALEYRISRHWSAELGGMYSYWHFNSKNEFQGISGYWLEPRYHYVVTGKWLELFLGIYGRVGDYDSRTPDNNYTGDYWDAGVSAGTYLHLIGGWGLEAGARVGYLKTQAMRYVIDGQYNWFENKIPYGKMRVTGLNLNLVYRFK